MPAVEVPTLVRIEYLTNEGWVHAGDVNVLHPENIVPRYREHLKFARVTVLDDRLAATGLVYVDDDLPEPGTLVPSETRVPKLPEADKTCPLCDEEHPLPWDGKCLL